MHGLKHYRELRDTCQQDVSLSLDQLHSIVICRPVFLIINEKTGFPRKHRVQPPGLSWFQKNLSSQRAFLVTDSLLNKTLVSDYDVPDTTKKNHL